MKVPYGFEIIESCADCTRCQPGFFCAFSETAAKAVDLSSHRSTLPAAAILFVEGQMPRGLVLCSGKVKLSTTSREGKVLILKTAEAGEALGLSAAISGQSYGDDRRDCYALSRELRGSQVAAEPSPKSQ
jgi:CRP/FNR family cyclic AMP-dependent transcriptional regulator